MSRRWLVHGGGGLTLMLLGGLVGGVGASLAARRLHECEKFFGFSERVTGAVSIHCTAPLLLTGLGLVLALAGSLHLPFGIALWNFRRQSSRGDSR